MGGKLTHDEVVKTVDFCLNAFKETSPEERKKVLDKVAAMDGTVASNPGLEKLTDDELQILNHIRAKQMLRVDDSININHFGSDAINGLAPNLRRGDLGLVAKATENTLSKLEIPVIDLLVQVEETEPISVAA